MLNGIRTRLNAVPSAVSVPLALIVLAGLMWWILHRTGGANDYPQPVVKLICEECGYAEELTASQYADRSEAELPGGVALIQGPALRCPNCGQRCLERQQRSIR